MSVDNNEAVTESQPELDLEDLDNFSDTFFGKEKPQEDSQPSAEAEDDESPEDVPPVDSEEVVEESDDADDETDDEEAEKPEPQGKKPSRSQQRITELNTKFREEQRQRQLLEDRLAAIEAGSQKTDTPAPKQAVTTESPTPADQNEDGSDKYPLGEFDPSYIRDLTKFTIAEAQKEADEVRSRTETQRSQQAEAERLTTEWQEKQAPARERYPDYPEKVASLEDVFAGVDQAYGDYLAQTVMQMDKGPDVLYYLAENPQEARDIVKAGGVKAAIALGRLETKFLDDKPQPKVKVSKAPDPAPQNKGSAGGRKTVAPDTDDLDAFASEFFKKRG